MRAARATPDVVGEALPGRGKSASAQLLSEAYGLQEQLRRIRRELHRTPEVGLVLPATRQLVLDGLAGYGSEVRVSEATSSVIAFHRATAARSDSAPLVVLRADMDALPIREQSGEPFASDNGAMHACGHDLHMAMLIGAARLLARRQLDADVAFVFQAGEEGHGGARLLLDDPALGLDLERAMACYAIHVEARVPDRLQFATRENTIMSASSDLTIVLKGRGGHGSTPHETLDPMPAAAAVVLALQSLVTRRFDVFDPVVISVGMIAAGSAFNAIPEDVRIGATVRYFSADARERLETESATLVRAIAHAHGLEAEVVFHEINPPTRNDPAEARFVLDEAEALFGGARVRTLAHPLMQSEDYSMFLEKMPGAMVLMGAAPEEALPEDSPANHAPDVRFDDSRLFEGAALLCSLALYRPQVRR